MKNRYFILKKENEDLKENGCKFDYGEPHTTLLHFLPYSFPRNLWSKHERVLQVDVCTQHRGVS